MKLLLLAAAAIPATALPAMPARAQSTAPALQQAMPHTMAMPGMAPAATPKPAAKRKPALPAPRRRAPARRAAAPAVAAPDAGAAHAGHAMPATAAMPGMAMPAAGPASGPDQEDRAMPEPAAQAGDSAAPTGTDQPAGTAPPPPIAHDRIADRYYGREAMAAAQAKLLGEHGGMVFSQLLFNLAEYQARRGGDGYRWEGEGWIGGDIDRFVVKTQGEGGWRGRVDSAEVQALYSRAIDPYWNLQAGIRQDFRPGPARTYATLGVEGLAPYWIELTGALFLSDRGDLLARAEGYYDQRLTRRLVLQPRIELNLAAQDVPANRIGAGLSDAELGLRLRYEIRREFAPYIGISHDRKLDGTARYARLAGESSRSTSVVIGIRTWF
ncbi:MAG: copper resistance protein B [Pseudomonadota bacterium]